MTDTTTTTAGIDTFKETSAPDARFEALGDHLTDREPIEKDIARFKTRL